MCPNPSQKLSAFQRTTSVPRQSVRNARKALVSSGLISNDEETSGSTCNWLPSIVSESHKLFTAFDQPGIF